MSQCNQCGAINRPGARFCAVCGQGLTAVSPLPAPIPPASFPPPTPAKRRPYPQIAIMIGILLVGALFGVGWLLSRDTSTGGGANSANDRNESGGVTVRLATPTPRSQERATAVAPTPTFTPLKIPGTNIEIPHISDEEEIEIGREVAAEVEAQFGVYRNAEQLNRVIEIGRTIIPHSDRPQLPYTFNLLDTDEINAFAVPGGYIYVTRGLLDFVRDDDELAAVIGHEIAHVARRHGAKKLEAYAVAEAAGRWLLSQDSRLEDIYATSEGKMATDITAVLLFNGWSRQDEYEADKYATLYMSSAGYDPQAAVRLLKRMETTFASGEEDVFTRLLATHPPFADRVQRVETVIVENGL